LRDLFISYASEDKDSIVKPLVTWLVRLGVDVWYDEFELTVGDSLSRSIDKGLLNCRYGLVVLSPAFFAKRWTEYELRGLIAKEIETGKVVLPIWWGVTKQDVLRYSPPLADKRAIDASNTPLPTVASEILEAVNPEKHKQMMAEYIRAMMFGQFEPLFGPEANTAEYLELAASFTQSRFGPIPASAISRARLIYSILEDVIPASVEQWVESFKVDWVTEIPIWEQIATVYQIFSKRYTLDLNQKRLVISILSALSLGQSDQEIMNKIDNLPPEIFSELKELYQEVSASPKTEPLYDDNTRQDVEKAYVEKLRKQFRDYVEKKNKHRSA